MFGKFGKIFNKKVAKIENKGGTIQDTLINSPFATINKDVVDNVIRLMQEGKTGEASDIINRLMKSASAQHPLYPHYRLDMKYDTESGLTISHVPTSKESLERLPMHGSMSIVIPDDMKKSFKTFEEMVQDAYYNQKTLEFDALAFKTMIGDNYVVDEFNGSGDGSAKIFIKPQEFPPPKPFKFFIEGADFSLDYLMLGVVRIESKSVVVLDNYKQESSGIMFELKLDFATKGASFNIKIRDGYEGDVRAHYTIARFLHEANNRKVGLEELETRKRLFSSNASEVKLDSVDNDELRRRVIFFSNLLKVEEFFDVDLVLPETITKNDEETLLTLLKIMSNEPVELVYESVSIVVYGKEQADNLVEICETNPNGIQMTWEGDGGGEFELFGSKIAYSSAKFVAQGEAVIEDLESLRDRSRVMQNGDSLSVNFIPRDLSKNEILAYYTVDQGNRI